MTEPLERDEVIKLLESLGSERDEDVLEAARRVHAQVSAAGMSWEDLLIPEDVDLETDDTEESEEVYESLEPEDQDLEAEAAERVGEASETNAESLAQIDRLLAKSDISDALREELQSYKTDIAEGTFAMGDRRYLRALSKRLSKKP